MALVRTADLVRRAVDKQCGLGAFNVICLEHAEAIAAGAEAAGGPAVLQVSHNAVRFHGGAVGPLAAACRAVADGSTAPLALHLDHVEDDELFDQAYQHGFSSVMYDASTLPYEDNLAKTRAAAERGHRVGLWIESELGEVGGKDGAHAVGARTDPAEAAAFVAATGVDGLAVAVGSSHAMTERSATLDLGLVARLRSAVPVPLVLHGSSGVRDEDLAAAVAAGMVKVNVGTALNVAYTEELRGRLAADRAGVDPRRYLAPARDAMAQVVEHVLRVLAPSP